METLRKFCVYTRQEKAQQ